MSKRRPEGVLFYWDERTNFERIKDVHFRSRADWKGLCFSTEEFDTVLHNFYFNWKVAAAIATSSFNHTRLRGATTSNELLYQVTDTLNHYLF